MKSRDYAFDNVRFILIVLVVFAHFLEITQGYGADCTLYRIIYSFHMPVLIFISGYFAKFNFKKIIKTFILYIVFQSLYIGVSNLCFDAQLYYNLIIPYWLMWYLLVYLFYLCLVPVLDYDRKNLSIPNKYVHMITMFVISITLYFASPYLFEYGEVLSILRFFTFLPYFVAGYYFKKIICDNIDGIFKSKDMSKMVKVIFLLLAITSSLVIAFSNKITTIDLYGSQPSHESHYLLVRLILLLCAFNFIGFFTLTLRYNKKISFITKFGGNTLVVFLLHGFIIRLVEYYNWFSDYSVNIVFVLFVSILLVILLGNIKLKDLINLSYKDK